jgi:hypothetical protein
MVQGASNPKTKDFKNQIFLKEREIYEGNNRRDGRKSVEYSGKKGRVEISKLPQILKEKGDIVYQALGWLAREEKILFHRKEGRTYTSLNPEEREKFKRSV